VRSKGGGGLPKPLRRRGCEIGYSGLRWGT